MKVKTLLTALFCMSVLGAVAQEPESTAGDPIKGFPIGTATGVDPFYPGDNSLKYQFPVQKLECGGKGFEANAVVTYLYYSDEKKYRNICLQVYLKPLDSEGMRNPGGIAEYNGYGTVVYHKCFELEGPRKKFKGSADAYARAFSYYSPTANDELKLEYMAVFDAENPEKNSIKYRLSEFPWPEPDGKARYKDYPARGYFADWEDDIIHFDRFQGLDNYSDDYWDNAWLLMNFHCFNTMEYVESHGRDYKSSNPGRIQAYIDFDIRGMKGGTTMSSGIGCIPYYRSHENDGMIFNVGAKSDGKVTVEENMYIRLGRDQQFLDSAHGDRYGFRFRASAECCYNKSNQSKTGKFMYVERATFTYMLYN